MPLLYAVEFNDRLIKTKFIPLLYAVEFDDSLIKNKAYPSALCRIKTRKQFSKIINEKEKKNVRTGTEPLWRKRNTDT